MLELRYNGCADCLHTAKTLLRNAGFFVGKHYKVVYHKDHAKDRIYEKRPDYLRIFSGAIIYNPETESWIDIYDSEHIACVACVLPPKRLSKLVHELSTVSDSRKAS